MARLENLPLSPGQGRVSGTLSVFLGALCLVGVLCFHFPQYLTTPDLRKAYDVELLRQVLRVAMLLSVALGSMTFFRWKSKRLGFLGISLTLVAHWLGGANVYVDDFQQPAISFGFDYLVLTLPINAFLFVFIEKMFPHKPEQMILRREWKLDMVYFVFNHLMIGVILLITTFFSETLFGWAVNEQVQSIVRSQPSWLQFVEVLFLADFTQYWGHRWMHTNPSLWKFHAVHHCPAEMDWLSGSRLHFFEVLFTRSTVILPIYLLGFAENAINGYVIWVALQAVLIHSNTDLPFGPLRYLFATPQFHHWHHAADAEAIDKNFASNLPVLDMMFGSYYGESERWPDRYGVVGKPLPRGFVAQHLYPFMADHDSE